MTIRAAEISDWKAIQALNFQIFEHELTVEPSSNLDFPYSDEATSYFKKACVGADGFNAFVACTDSGSVVGYAIVRQIPSSELTHRVNVDVMQLHTFCVDASHRSQGIGTKLLKHCKDFAAQSGANKFKIVAYANNTGARNLYDRFGFSEFEVGYEMDI